MAVSETRRSHADDRVRAAFPVVEVFGPTVQGEGPEAGRPAYFVRFGGCDYRCAWCDSMYAVDPDMVKAEARRLTADEILKEIGELENGPSLVVLTGGNPALFELSDVVAGLRERGLECAVETQGSLWRDWLASVDRLVVSPKGPSSGMHSDRHRAQFREFMTHAPRERSVLKVVVFDDADFAWAEQLAADFSDVPFFLSAGTDVGLAAEATLLGLTDRFRWLCEQVARSQVLARARVLPQLHVLAWGTARGV